MAVDVLRLVAEFEALRADRKPVEAVWDEIERFVMPMTGKTNATRPAMKTDVEVWDLTAALGNEHLAASLHGNVTSPDARWIDAEWPDEELEKDQPSRAYREALMNLVWSEIQASDFNMEIASGYLEYGGIGNMLLMAEAYHPTVYDGMDFTAIPCREGYPVPDSRRGLKKFFRHLRWTPVQVKDRFEEKTPGWIEEILKGPDGATRKIDVVFCIFRRETVPLKRRPEDDGPLAPEARPFGCVYFTLENPAQLGDEGGYYEMPVVHARWGRLTGETWGFGRGNMALRSTQYLCAFKESARAAQAKAANPPAVGTERGVLSPPDLEEGGYTVTTDLDAIKFLTPDARFDVAVEVLRDERAEIRRCFHEDDLQLKESPAMTATEVQARRDLMNRVLGSPVGRLQTDALQPIVEIVIAHLAREKRLPEPPELVKQKKAELKIRFRGPIARAQVMDEVVGIEREAAFVSSLLKMGFEEARFHFDVGQAIREHAKRVGAPATTLRSAAKVRELEEQARQAAMRQVNANASKTENEAALRGAQALAAAGGMPSGGVPLAIAPQPALAPSGGSLA